MGIMESWIGVSASEYIVLLSANMCLSCAGIKSVGLYWAGGRNCVLTNQGGYKNMQRVLRLLFESHHFALLRYNLVDSLW